MSRAVWDRLLSEVAQAYRVCPALAEFTPFPEDLTPVEVVPFDVPPAQLLQNEAGLTGDRFAAVREAFVAAAPQAQWHETYKETSIGQDFMDRFGCYCLIGDGGAFQSPQFRAWMVYMPAGLHYPWHHHPAEEMYLVLGGAAEFHREGMPSETLRAGETSFHASNQPHAMTTTDSPVMCLVVWRNGFETGPCLTEREVQ
jgi:quercetin dioxygenase-like cupin family protein